MNENNIMNENNVRKENNLKNEYKGIIFLIIPLLIVTYMLLSNVTTFLVGKELKFEITSYDPFDIIRGRYLNVSFVQDKILLNELSGYYYEEHGQKNVISEIDKFIFRYLKLDTYKKEKVNLIFDDLQNELKTNNFESFDRREVIDYFKKYVERLISIDYNLVEKNDIEDLASSIKSLAVFSRQKVSD